MAAHGSVSVAVDHTGRKCARDVKSAGAIPDPPAEGLPAGPKEHKTDLLNWLWTPRPKPRA